MKQILLAGSFGRGNLGEDAILGAMLDDLRRCAPSAGFSAIVGDSPGLLEPLEVETIPWNNWPGISVAVQRSDLVILGGGGILYEDPGYDPGHLMRHPGSDLVRAAGIALLAKIYNKPLMLYAVGLGPLLGEASREAVRLVFGLADTVTVRDAESRTLAAALGIDANGIEITADPALGMRIDSEDRAREILRESGCDPSRPVIVVAPKPWAAFFSPADWAPTVAAALRAMMRNDGAQVLCVPFHPAEDDAWISVFNAFFKEGELHRSPPLLRPSEAAALVGACDLVVGLRLHAMVFAARAGTPGVALTCEPKLRSFMEQTGQSERCVETKNLAQFDGALAAAWSKRQQLREEFARAGAALRPVAARSAEVAAEMFVWPRDAAAASPLLLDALRQMIEGRMRIERQQELAELAMEQKIEQQIEELSMRNHRIAELEALLAEKGAELARIDNSFFGRLHRLFNRSGR